LEKKNNPNPQTFLPQRLDQCILILGKLNLIISPQILHNLFDIYRFWKCFIFEAFYLELWSSLFPAHFLECDAEIVFVNELTCQNSSMVR